MTDTLTLSIKSTLACSCLLLSIRVYFYLLLGHIVTVVSWSLLTMPSYRVIFITRPPLNLLSDYR